MNIIAGGEVAARVLAAGEIGIGGDIAMLAGVYRSIAAGTFKPAGLTDAQLAAAARVINVLAVVCKDPAGKAEVLALVQSL